MTPPPPATTDPLLLPWAQVVSRYFFTESAPTPIQSISFDVRMCVCFFFCLSVTLCSLLRLNIFLPPLQCPNYLDIRNPGRKVMEKWSRIWKLLLKKGVKLLRKKCFFWQMLSLIGGFFWYWCYYPHRSKDLVSSVCRIFFIVCWYCTV